MTNTAANDPSTHKSVVSVGLDGSSRPMWRYLADLHLPDHQRRIVAPEHRPDARTCRHCAEPIEERPDGDGWRHVAAADGMPYNYCTQDGTAENPGIKYFLAEA